MSRERELLKKLYHAVLHGETPQGENWFDVIEECTAILSQPESEPPPADAPTQDKCPECGSTDKFYTPYPCDFHYAHPWHAKEPAPQQTDDEAAKSSDGANVLPSPRQSAADRGPTPETDALYFAFCKTPSPEFAPSLNKSYEHSANLERQRDAARAELARLKAPRRMHSCDDPLCAVCGQPYG